MSELIENVPHHDHRPINSPIDSEEEEINLPMWLQSCGRKFLRQIIHDDDRLEAGGHKVQVNDFSVKLATKKGDNYASIMYRLQLNFKLVRTNNNVENYNRLYIIKTFPDGELQKQIMIKNNIFPREIKFYRRILPQINGILSRLHDDDSGTANRRISPLCITTFEEPKTTLVFEDLACDGYCMKNRQSGLDYDESMILFTKLAKLHACTAHLYQQDHSLMNEFLEGSINDNPERQDFLIFYKYNARMLCALVNQWEQHRDIAKKLETFDRTIIERGAKIFRRNDQSFNVLNHNDIWINNLMFKYDGNGKIEDILMLDYQLAYWGSPGVDINFLLYGTIQDDVREKYTKHFIRHYHNVLADTLQRVGYVRKMPTVQDIHVEIIKTGFHAVNASINLRPLAAMEDTENAEMDIFLKDTIEGQAFRERIFFNPKFVKFIQSQIVEFDLMGYFD